MTAAPTAAAGCRVSSGVMSSGTDPAQWLPSAPRLSQAGAQRPRPVGREPPRRRSRRHARRLRQRLPGRRLAASRRHARGGRCRAPAAARAAGRARVAGARHAPTDRAALERALLLKRPPKRKKGGSTRTPPSSPPLPSRPRARLLTGSVGRLKTLYETRPASTREAQARPNTHRARKERRGRKSAHSTSPHCSSPPKRKVRPGAPSLFRGTRALSNVGCPVSRLGDPVDDGLPPGPGKGAVATAQGHPRAIFQRAIERGNLARRRDDPPGRDPAADAVRTWSS